MNSLPPAVRYSGRIAALDIARGLAVLGMFVAHVGPERGGLLGWFLDLADGRSSILFAMLAGVSLAILTGRNVPYSGVEWLQAKIRIFTRAALLLVFSAVLALMNDYVALILSYYATWFVLAIPFLLWSRRRLIILAGMCWVVGPLVATYVPAFLEKAGMMTSGDSSSFLVETLLTGSYVGVIYMGFVFAGIAIGRSDLTGRNVPLVLVPVGASLAIVGYGLAWLLTTLGVGSEDDFYFGGSDASWSWEDQGWRTDGVGPDWDPYVTWPSTDLLLGAEPHSGTIFEAIGSGGFALAVIGLLLLGGPMLGKILYPIGAVGSMSLTAYSTHIIAIWAIPALGFPDSMTPLLWLLLVTLTLCSLWRALVGRGPLEWVMFTVSRRAAQIPRNVPEPPSSQQLASPSQPFPQG